MPLVQEHLRPLVLECVRTHSPIDHWNNAYDLERLFLRIAEIARDRDLDYNKNGVKAWNELNQKLQLHNNLRAPINGIVWDLIFEGILRPGKVAGDCLGLPFFHVSEYGQEVLSGSVTAHDPEGYLNEISAKVPNADKIIVQYIAESAETFRRNCLLSSTVTLGCACEKAFLLLSEAYRDALNRMDKSAYERRIANTRGIKQHHQEFKNCYEQSLRQKLKTSGKDNDWLTAVDGALTLLFQYFRDMRNDAGHPMGVALGKELVHSHLVVFPYYLRLIYDLIEWLSANKPT